MLYIIKTAFPDDTDTFRLRNETLAYGASPSMRLWRAISPSTSALVQHELKRQFLVADISAGIGKMGLERGFRTTLETLQTVIDEQLFKGPSGETENTVMYSLHGENNECLHYSESRDELRAGYSQHIKRREFSVRPVRDFPFKVQTDIRQKPDESAIAKVLARGFEDDGKFDLVGNLSDSLGLQFTVFGTSEGRDEFAERVMNLFLNDPRIRLDPDNPWEYKPNVTNGRSSQRHRFTRYKMNVVGSVPVEIIFRTGHEHYDSQYDVGEWDEENTQFTGAAHALYEQTRLLPLLPELFPESLYGRNPLEYATDHIWNRAEVLKAKHRAR